MEKEGLPLVPGPEHFMEHQFLKNTHDVSTSVCRGKLLQVELFCHKRLHLVLGDGLHVLFLYSGIELI